MLGRQISKQDVFDLHKAVQTEKITDIYKPYGDWKVEPNGTYALDSKSKQIYIEYAQPQAVPVLMDELIDYINSTITKKISLEDSPILYARIHMGIAHAHPFWNGNGRVARLMSNIPLLNSGLPPIVINKEDRRRYIKVLSRYQIQVGEINGKTGLWPAPEKLKEFALFCEQSYKTTTELVENAKIQQQKRDKSQST